MNSRDLLDSSARLSRELLAIIHDEPSTIDQIAAGIVHAATSLLPEHGIAVTLHVDRAHSIHAGSTPTVEELVALETRTRTGPATRAARDLRPADHDGLTDGTGDAWAAALERAGFCAVLAVPIEVGGTAAGVISVHQPGIPTFAERDRDSVMMLAQQAALVVEGGRRIVQLRDAVISRDVIGQAKGILMSRYGIDATTAFGRLVEASQDMNVKLVDIARWYVTDQDGAAPSRPS
ncbi:GAF and ANTAR domain-containing protein [Actinomycetospora termitidis]|uniref:GAF and ANTAR domain-containing protein n=1 Tax=Actinomycetospora termitidis TaxID=3053470 RepID=A0ABT7MC11_9PSEU|nr:GAF and ANTAR domain-containing protein [Actinomycetospora sp. Odt1-22]MDL5158200.1 GAF and ANTAR domain-containing protein [Actinomycetospora sp. Odt1-22]